MRNRIALLTGGSLGAMAAVLRNADNGGAGGGEAATGGAGGGSASPESVLYPNEGGAGDSNQSAGNEGGDKSADGAAADWKEYVPDPAKSDEENAAAKAEHDKTKPAEKSDAEKALDEVPEDGKYEISLPDDIPLDTALLDRFSPKFKEAKLTRGQVQAVVSEYAAMRKDEVTARTETWANTIQGWADQAKADKDIGGDKWGGTVQTATRAVNSLGTPALKEYLEASGGGNHPELIRFMAKVGAMIREDNPASGTLPGKGREDRASILYPEDKPKGN